MKTFFTIIIILALFVLTMFLLISIEGNKETKQIDKIYEDEYVKRHTDS